MIAILGKLLPTAATPNICHTFGPLITRSIILMITLGVDVPETSRWLFGIGV